MTDNMRIWNYADKTDEKHTKHVAQRGGFTSIKGTYQIMRATELWGPMGSTWGIRNIKLTISPTWDAIVMQAEFWYPDGAFDMVSDIDFTPGQDDLKKLHTDLTKKALSKLGFSADIFLGSWDDDKYTDSRKAKTPDKAPQEPQQAKSGGEQSNTFPCPRCDGTVREVNGKNGPFWGCSKWHSGCKFSCQPEEVSQYLSGGKAPAPSRSTPDDDLAEYGL